MTIELTLPMLVGTVLVAVLLCVTLVLAAWVSVLAAWVGRLSVRVAELEQHQRPRPVEYSPSTEMAVAE